jgi:photosystem II stability/assembly factor-like uncharacterized protein
MKAARLILTPIVLVFLITPILYAQSIGIVHTGDKTSLRGLSVVNDKIIWVSGSHGIVGRSLDSGKTWKWITVQGFEQRDFRDIEAFDAVTAVIMAIGEPAQILKTVNGGESWTSVYVNKKPGMFLDAMEFWNDQSGIVLGDPVDGRFFIARTFDEGSSWQAIEAKNLPEADSGEAAFASSGTNIRRLDRDEACFISGGKKSRLFWRGSTYDLPFALGKETVGANSIAVRDDKKIKDSKYFIVVGGDFTDASNKSSNCFITKDGGKTWITPASPPTGYRSCVEFVTKTRVITSGINGVDLSDDGGMNWKNISGEGFHVCRKAKNGKSVFLAGANGKIGILNP